MSRKDKDKKTAYILGVFDHKYKYYHFREEHDPKGKDDLGFWYNDSLKAVRKGPGNSMPHHYSMNKYLVDHIDTCKQVILATFDVEHSDKDAKKTSRSLHKQWRVELGRAYKKLGYKPMNTYGQEKTELKVA